MRGLRRAAVALMALMIAVGLLAGVAGAKKQKKRKGKTWASQITLVHPVPTELSGTVSSGLGACCVQRLVTVYYTDPQTGQTLPLSVQRTDGDGRYQVSLPKSAFAGTYVAQVSEQRIRAKKAPQTCKAAESPPVSV